MLALMARILMPANVVPGPAVEAPLLNVGDIVGRQVIANRVALIYRTPKFSCFGMDRHADAISDSPGVNALAGSIGIELEHIGAMKLDLIVIRVVYIRV